MTDNSLVLVAGAGDSTISTLRLADGNLERIAVRDGVAGCSNFAVDSARDLVHAAVKSDAENEDAGILTFTLDRATGALEPRDRQPLPQGGMNYLTLTRDGSVLLGAAYGAGYGIVCPVVDGVVGAPVSEVRFPRLHSVLPSRDGRFVYFVSLEADLIAQYALGDDLQLKPLEPETVACPPGSGPRHLVVEDDHVYVLTEFSGEVLHFDRDGETGVLTARDAVPAYDLSKDLGHSVIDEDPLAHHYIWGADIHRGDGVLWCSERTESTLAAVPVAADGSVSAPTTFTVTEAQPRGFALSPDGAWLVAAGERSSTVSLYAVSGGALELRGQADTGRGSNWVRFA